MARELVGRNRPERDVRLPRLGDSADDDFAFGNFGASTLHSRDAGGGWIRPLCGTLFQLAALAMKSENARTRDFLGIAGPISQASIGAANGASPSSTTIK